MAVAIPGMVIDENHDRDDEQRDERAEPLQDCLRTGFMP
jgi:hypothetical protein